MARVKRGYLVLGKVTAIKNNIKSEDVAAPLYSGESSSDLNVESVAPVTTIDLDSSNLVDKFIWEIVYDDDISEEVTANDFK